MVSLEIAHIETHNTDIPVRAAHTVVMPAHSESLVSCASEYPVDAINTDLIAEYVDARIAIQHLILAPPIIKPPPGA